MAIITIKKTGRTWGVFGQLTPRDAPAFIEGGFAARSSAQLARDRIARECLQDEVASAERAAGWDPNP